MRYSTITILLVCVLCISSCKNSVKENKEVVSYHENGKIKKRAFSSDSINIVLEFNQMGILIDSINYNLNNKIQGIRKHLHADSIDYYSFVNYENGNKEGDVYGLYSNGKTKFKGTHSNDKKSGEWCYYDIQGNRATYEFFSNSGSRRYLRKYIDGRYDYTDGEGIIYWSYNSDTINKGEEFRMKLGFATPPDCVIKLFVAEELTEEKLPKDDEFYEYDPEGNELIYTKQFEKSGVFEKGFAWLLVDTITGVEERDFDILKVVVLDTQKSSQENNKVSD